MGKKKWTKEEREHLSRTTTEYQARKRMKPIAEIEHIAKLHLMICTHYQYKQEPTLKEV